MNSFTMYIEKPMSWHEQMYRVAVHLTDDVDVLVKNLIREGFIAAGDPDAKGMANDIVSITIGQYLK